MTPPDLQFPLLSFGRNVSRFSPGDEVVDCFPNETAFNICAKADLRKHALDDMLLADSAGRCWRIERVSDLGVTGPFWDRVIRFVFRQAIHGVSCELVEVQALSLDALKARVRDIIEADPERWKDDEAVAGEDGPPRDEREMLDELLEAVQIAPSVPEIVYALFPGERPT